MSELEHILQVRRLTGVLVYLPTSIFYLRLESLNFEYSEIIFLSTTSVTSTMTPPPTRPPHPPNFVFVNFHKNFKSSFTSTLTPPTRPSPPPPLPDPPPKKFFFYYFFYKFSQKLQFFSHIHPDPPTRTPPPPEPTPPLN